MTITGCIIAKNEEKVLDKCLSSLKPITDQIVFVDTGSNDDSIVVARKYGAEVYDFQWRGDFSIARNFALGKAKGEWIAFLDADEYMETDPGWLKSRLENENSDALICSFIDVERKIEGRPVEDRHVRIFRNSPEIRYRRSIHEYLYKSTGRLEFSDCRDKIKVFHSGYTLEVMKEKDKYFKYVSMLLNELKITPFDSELHYLLGATYRCGSEWMKAMFHLESAIEYNDFRVEQYRANAHVLRVMIMVNRGTYIYDSMQDMIDEYLRLFPGRAELLACRGIILTREDRIEEALPWLEKSLQMYNNNPIEAEFFDELYMAVNEFINTRQ